MEQVWFADDATAGGSLHRVKDWWDELDETGSIIGYYANAINSWLIVKEEQHKQALNAFANSGVKITKMARNT